MMRAAQPLIRALQWRLLLLWSAWMLVPSAIVALPVWQLLGASLDYSVHADALAQQLDMTALADLMAAHGKSSAAFTALGMIALIVTLLISPLLAGMTLAAARAPQALGIADLTRAALAAYPRMLRMLLWASVPLGAALLLGAAAIDAAADYGATAIVAADADLASAAAAALAALLFAIAHASVDAGRAMLALEPARRSAVKAWWSGCLLLVRRPFATLGLYLLITGLGLALASLLALARLNLGGASLAGVLGALALTQLTVAAIGWMRMARLFALTELAAAQSAKREQAIR